MFERRIMHPPSPLPLGSPSDGAGYISLLWPQYEWSWKEVWLTRDWCYVYRLPFQFIDHSYRSSSEVQAVRKEKDAIKLVEAYALNGELATAEELKVLIIARKLDILHLRPLQELQKSAKSEVKEAVEFATSGSELPSSELYTHIHSDQDEMGLYIRGCDPFTSNTSQAQP